MLGWGSWANTQKACNRDAWPFPLFYWDYAIGVFLFSLLAGFGLQLAGPATTNTLSNLRQSAIGPIAHAIASGVLFNVANLLLVVAIDEAGLAVAFPLGIGLALVIGTIISYLQAPKGNPLLIGFGVLLILTAMLLSAIAHRRMGAGKKRGARGPVFAIIAGCVMGTFYPQLEKALSPDFQTGTIVPGTLAPFAALIVFSLGVLASNLIINTIFMRAQGIGYGQYRQGDAKTHLWGLLGGAIWMIAFTCNILASGVAGPAISYALGQGATLVAALWGVFVWKEFQGASSGTWRLVVLMLASYAFGLVLIGSATFS
jgi:glucose uptake protein